MKPKSRNPFLPALVAAIRLTAALSPLAPAQNTWTGSVNAVFSNGANFDPVIANTALSNLNVQFDGTDTTTEDLTLAAAFGGGANSAGSVVSVLDTQTDPVTITGSGSAAIRISTGFTVASEAGAVTLAGTGNFVIGGVASPTNHAITNNSSNLLDLGSWLVIGGGGGSRTVAVDGSGDVTSNAEWRNAIILNKSGAGTLTLGGANTFTGATSVTGGSLVLTNALALQNSALDTTGLAMVSIDGPITITFGGLNGAVDMASLAAGYSGITDLTLNPGSGVTATYSGAISDGAAAMNLIKTGSGIQVLSGTNNYTGATTVSAGTLRLGNADALGDGADNTSDVTVNGTAIFDLAGISPTADVPLNLNSTANGFDVGSFTNSSGGTSTFSGDIDLQAATVRAGALSPNHMTLTGTLTGNGNNFTKDGSNIMTLTGSGTVSLGILRVFRGTLLLDAGTALNPAGDLFLGGGNSVGTILTLNGGSLTVPSGQTATFGAGTGTASSTLNLNSGTLTVPGIVKGTQNYSVNFNGGTLMANADNASFMTAIGGSAKVLAGGAFIDDGGFAIAIDQPLIDDTTPTGGGLTKSGAGTLTLYGVNTYSGDTTVSAGTLDLADTGSLKFIPTSDGSTNKVTGTGSADFNGTFNIDLTNADPTDGNSWVLADVSSRTFDSATFTVSGFNESPEGTWTFVDGSNTWTFTQSDATLRLAAASAGFSSWIATFPAVGGQNQPGDDPDNDGLENLLEFVLNGNPTVSDSSIPPDLAVTATDFEFTYQRRDDSVSPETTQTFQYGSNLSGWTDVVVPAASATVGAATITVTGGSPADTVKISIPKTEAGGAGKLFGRLQVIK